VCGTPPAALLRKAAPGYSTVQIVRTQPEEDDFTIKDIYFNATRVAAAGTGYLYLENQYFQYEEWAKHLLAVRKKVIAGWNRNCGKIGKGAEEIPVMHVFVVIPAPEAAEMIPRTYETLATLGQQDGLTGQVKMIDEFNGVSNTKQPEGKQPAFRGVSVTRVTVPEVVTAANKIDKPSALILEKTYGLKVCVAVLNACGYNLARREWHYREIYIHSKLLLIDDGFFTLGSANLNQRSMAADSEINLATNDPRHATALRKRIWTQLATEKNNGGNATPQEIEDTFINWVNLMKKNKDRQKSRSPDPKEKKMEGFIVPLDDRRSSTARHG
jgi:phosphatidylserine/phosphatidylglycerophosphate/cardiolipin synthase-like enzyme